MSRPSILLALLSGCNYLGADSLDRDDDGVLDYQDCDFNGPGSAWLEIYEDTDGDGFGDPSTDQLHCEADPIPDGWVDNDGDCDDDNPDAHPQRHYADPDRDGYPSSSTPEMDCQVNLDDWVLPDADGAVPPVDCAPDDPAIHPGATELPNNDVDEDCDGVALLDGDGDGQDAVEYGGIDCDDTDPTVFVGATEVCDGIDNDCDGLVDAGDDSLSLDEQFLPDADGDGIPGSLVPQRTCDPTGFIPYDPTLVAADCDDDDPLAYPGAAEVAYNEVDEDCDGADLLDQDGDGFDSAAYGGDDCNDDPDTTGPVPAALIHPGAFDASYDGVDADCAGDPDDDRDGDGFAMGVGPGLDCDDDDPNVFPGARERIPGIDHDCDGTPAVACYPDSDLDGYGSGTFEIADGEAVFSAGGEVRDACMPNESAFAGDCDDTDTRAYPTATEVCDGVDNDCDGIGDASTVTVVGPGVFQHYTGLVPGETIDATSAHEVAICPGPGLSIAVEAGELAGRSLWIDGTEVHNDALEDSVIRATADGSEPAELLVESLRFRGVSAEPVIDVQTDPGDALGQVEVRDVDFEVEAPALVHTDYVDLTMERVTSSESTTSFHAFQSVRTLAAEDVLVESHQGPVLSMNTGEVAGLVLNDGQSMDAAVYVGSNAIISDMHVAGGLYEHVLFDAGVTVLVGGTFTDVSTIESPIHVQETKSATIVGTTFTNTSGGASGGIVAEQSSGLYVVASHFDGLQTSGDGGAISTTGALVSVASSTFTDSVSPGYGGAAFVNGGAASFNSCVFEFNEADRGGAVAGTGSLVFAGDVYFTQNTAGTEGGALWSAAELEADGVYGSANTAPDGSLLYKGGGDLLVNWMHLEGHDDDSYGGAVIRSSGPVEIGGMTLDEPPHPTYLTSGTLDIEYVYSAGGDLGMSAGPHDLLLCAPYPAGSGYGATAHSGVYLDVECDAVGCVSDPPASGSCP